MKYVVSLSGGAASAVAAERAIERYGRENVHLWFADTSWEDEDVYRFLDDLMARWGGELEVYRDGRTPLEVASDKRIIPNQKIAPCSFALKIEPFVRFITAYPKPVTVLIGMTWAEGDRMRAPTRRYGAIEGVSVAFPWTWTPIEYRPPVEVVRSWGIAPPRQYALGFKHANCGGRCVKQGQREWLRLLEWKPERYAEVEAWEDAQRAKGGPRADYAIVRDFAGGEVAPLPLRELRHRREVVDRTPMLDDLFSCFCGDGEVS